MSNTPEAPHHLMDQLLRAEVVSVVDSATTQRRFYSDKNIVNEHDPHYAAFEIPLTPELTEQDAAAALTEKLHQKWQGTALFEIQEGHWKRRYWQSWDGPTYIAWTTVEEYALDDNGGERLDSITIKNSVPREYQELLDAQEAKDRVDQAYAAHAKKAAQEEPKTSKEGFVRRATKAVGQAVVGATSNMRRVPEQPINRRDALNKAKSRSPISRQIR